MLLVHNTWEMEVKIAWFVEKMIESYTNNSSSTPKLQDYIRKKMHNIAHLKNNHIILSNLFFFCKLMLKLNVKLLKEEKLMNLQNIKLLHIIQQMCL
jgi:hypothetical protein